MTQQSTALYAGADLKWDLNPRRRKVNSEAGSRGIVCEQELVDHA